MKIRTIAFWGAAASIAVFLSLQARGERPDPLTEGYVFVYYPSQCEKAGDSSNCHEIPSDRPAFTTQADCFHYLDEDLGKAGDPRRMGSCWRVKES